MINATLDKTEKVFLQFLAINAHRFLWLLVAQVVKMLAAMWDTRV